MSIPQKTSVIGTIVSQKCHFPSVSFIIFPNIFGNQK